MAALIDLDKLADAANSIGDLIGELNEKKTSLQAAQTSNEERIQTIEEELEMYIDERTAIGHKIVDIDKQLGPLNELRDLASRADGLISQLSVQDRSYENERENDNDNAVLTSTKKKRPQTGKKRLQTRKKNVQRTTKKNQKVTTTPTPSSTQPHQPTTPSQPLTPTTIQTLITTIQNAATTKAGRQFAHPVATSWPNFAKDYAKKIRHKVDLETMVEQLKAGFYHSVDEVRDDVNLLYENCVVYNGVESKFTGWAGELRDVLLAGIEEIEGFEG